VDKDEVEVFKEDLLSISNCSVHAVPHQKFQIVGWGEVAIFHKKVQFMQLLGKYSVKTGKHSITAGI
jgi:lipopolysaccharide export system protein LptA